MNLPRRILDLFVVFLIVLSACETLKSSKPLLPIKEYERMLVGRMDADYVGTKNCLAACHSHDQKAHDFEASTMGAQLSEDSGLPLVNCESCHGPGSLAIQGITSEKVKADAEKGIKTECNHGTLLKIKTLPSMAKSLVCLKCHTANATFNLHNWNMEVHAINDVACTDCHSIHGGPDLKVRLREQAEMCYQCHQEIRSAFSLPSHHPVPQKRVFCSDCHNPHGSSTDNLLREETAKETCTRCHGEKAGPFLYEHAENTEFCTRCHTPHGSVNNNLLNVRLPFLCLQCHPGHRTGTAADQLERKGAFYTRCTDCHFEIHGTDIPGASGTGRLTQ